MRQIEIWGDDDADDRTNVLKVLIPFLLCGLFLSIVWFLLPVGGWLFLFAMMVAYVVPPLGRESVIPLCILGGIPWWLAAFTIVFLDFAGGLFMAWNFPLLMRIPRVGPWISRFVEAGRSFLDRRPWLERLYFVGLIAFVYRRIHRRADARHDKDRGSLLYRHRRCYRELCNRSWHRLGCKPDPAGSRVPSLDCRLPSDLCHTSPDLPEPLS